MDDTQIAQVKMTMDEMVEVRRAISARIGNWIADGELGDKEEEIHLLMGAGEKLDAHIDDCLDQYEGNVARREAQILDDEEAVRKFMEGDK
jgi:hypothetical protein